MIQRASAQYQARLFIKAEEGGFWHRHHQGVEPFAPSGVALGAPSVTPCVNDGRWIVQCSHCGGAQLAAPEMDRFFCVDCVNTSCDGQWFAVEWPEAAHVEAIEAALSARPDIASRNWSPDETVGVLLAENHLAGLVDVEAEKVAGDIGFDQAALAASQPAVGRG